MEGEYASSEGESLNTPEMHSSEASQQESFTESLPVASDQPIGEETVAVVTSAAPTLPVAITADVTSDCAVVVDNLKSPENLKIISNVDSRTITRPRRQQVSGDVEVFKETSTVIPPTISATVQHINSTPVRKLDQGLKSSNELSIHEGLKRGDGKQPIHRTRQKTVTVYSQLSSEVANVFNERKEKIGDDSIAEVQNRIQTFISAKEREWASTFEKLMEEVNSREHKAAEYKVLVLEYDRRVKQMIEILKAGSKVNASNQSRQQKTIIGDPGPERTVSPDELALLRKERDQLAEDVMSWETSYNELYKRYERLKQASLEFRKTADDTKQAYDKLQQQHEEVKRKFGLLRAQAENELNRANVEMERQEKQRENDTLCLRLKVKHLEAKNSALATSLKAKTRELADMETLFEDIVHKADKNATEDFE
uniref:TACC_C domain-containing protein n=1 Tax=Syphacia muris TaxID=451379 RepID=A0A0N5AN59_9BILA